MVGIKTIKKEIVDTKELERTPDKNSGPIKEGPHIIVELIEYEHDAVVSKSIMKRAQEV